MGEKKVEREFTFEPFADTADYKKVNREIVSDWVGLMLQRGTSSIGHLLDIATGVGTMVELFLSQLPPRWNPVVVCLDQSKEALDLTRRRLESKVEKLQLVHSPIEEAKLPSEGIDVALWGNGIHYLSERAQKEALLRIKTALKPGGWLFCNTAFYSEARSPETLSFYKAKVKKAVESLRALGIRRVQQGQPEAAKFLPKAYYQELIGEVGLKIEAVREHNARLYRNAWECISGFHEYAKGALHGYPWEAAAVALKEAVAPALDQHGQKDEAGNLYTPRNWLAISARTI